MKKLIFFSSILLATTLQAQIGIKGGLTFNNDDGVFKSLETAYQQKGENNIGYHIGIFKEFQLLGFFVEPELLYVTYKNEYQPEAGKAFDVTYKRIDLPISAGKTLGGLLKLQAGPVFSYYFEDEIDWEQVSEINQDEVSIGLQVGAGIELKKFHVDVRYDFPLTDRQTDFVKEKQFKFETEHTPKLFHVSVGYEF